MKRVLIPILFELEAPFPFEVLVLVVIGEERDNAVFAFKNGRETNSQWNVEWGREGSYYGSHYGIEIVRKPRIPFKDNNLFREQVSSAIELAIELASGRVNGSVLNALISHTYNP